MRKKLFLLLSILMFLFLMVGCDNTNNVQQHEHEYSKEWAYDENEHWHAAVCEHDVISNKGNHKFNNGTITKQANEYESGIKTYRCQVCGYEKSETIPVVKPITFKVSFDLDGGTSNSYVQFLELKAMSPQLLFYDVEKVGYNFRGWSIAGQLIYDQYGNIIKDYVLSSNVTLKATFSNKAMLSLKPNMENAGTIIGSNEYTYNTNVDINATPNKGYEFVGWYYNGTLLSNQKDYRYKMWDKDITIEARFQLLSYNLTVSTSNKNSGLVCIGTGTMQGHYSTQQNSRFIYTHSVTVSAYTLLSDARFVGWYDSDTNKLVTPNAVYTFPMINRDYNLIAKWDKKNSYLLSLENNSTYGTVIGSGSYVEGQNVTISATPNAGYKFDGWYDMYNNCISTSKEYSFIMPSSNVKYFAKWKEQISNIYSVTLVKGFPNGTLIGSGSYQYGDNVTITATPNAGYKFDGWYSGSDLISLESNYSFIMPSEDVSYTAYFSLIDNYTSAEWYTTDDIVATETGATEIKNYNTNSSEYKILNKSYTFTNIAGTSITTSKGLKLNSAGKLSISTPKGNATLTVVIATENGQLKATPLVHAGTTNATLLSTTVNADTSTTYLFEIPSAGTWDIERGDTQSENNPIIYAKCEYDTLIKSNAELTFGTNGNYESPSLFNITAEVTNNGGDNARLKGGNIEFTVAAGAQVEVYANWGEAYTITLANGTVEAHDGTSIGSAGKRVYTYDKETKVTIACDPDNTGHNYFYWVKVTFPTA